VQPQRQTRSKVMFTTCRRPNHSLLWSSELSFSKMTNAFSAFYLSNQDTDSEITRKVNALVEHSSVKYKPGSLGIGVASEPSVGERIDAGSKVSRAPKFG
jgi:hypothetical protein